jgi:hypothetical protein
MVAALPAAATPRQVALRAGLALVLSVLLGLLLASRLAAQREPYHQTDENIAVAVVSHVLDQDTLDTNWAHTEVDAVFRYDQYNFSAYYLVAAAWLQLSGQADAPDRLPPLRQLSALLHALAIALAAWLGWRWGGPLTAALAALLTAASPTLVQDSLYARPETFVTVLTLGYLLLLGTRDAPSDRRLVAAGALCGVLLATKISFAPLAPLALLLRWRAPGAGPLRWRTVLAFVLAVACGIVLGAPGAVLDPAAYLHGIDYLLRQYSGGHLPHGLPHDGSLVRFAFGLDYLRHTAGAAVLLLAALGGATLARSQGRRVAWLAAGLLLLLAYFLQTRAFFERNLSPVLPLLYVLAGLGVVALLARLRTRPGRALLGAALTAALLWVPVGISHTLLQQALPGSHAQAQRAYETALAAAGHVLVDFQWARPGSPSAGLCGAVVLREVDYGHPYLRARAEQILQARGYVLLHHLRGPFTDLPASTLQTYHGADVRYHVAREPWPGDCALGLVGLRGPAQALATSEPRLEGHAARDGHEPGAVQPPGWIAPLYGTHAGSDSHTGAIGIATIRACDEFLLPVASGPNRDAVHFRVERRDATQTTVLFDGALPAVIGAWSGLRVRHAPPACADYSVRAEDASAEWGAWLGLGHPVRVVALPSPLPPAASR